MYKYLLEEFTISNNGKQVSLSESRILETDKLLREKSWWRGPTKMYNLSKYEICEIQNSRKRKTK